MVSGTSTGARAFVDAVWSGGDVFVDDAECFKRALGVTRVKARWALLPSVLLNIVSFAKRFGHDEGDIKEKQTSLLGGTVVVSRSNKVIYAFRETSTFDNGAAADVLRAVKAL